MGGRVVKSKSKLIFSLALIVIAALAGQAISAAALRRPVTAVPMRTAYYFGLNRYAWPVNWLSTIDTATLDRELQQIKRDGFDTIALCVSWGDIEPQLTLPPQFDQEALKRIKQVVAAADRHALGVIVRMPYVWSFQPNQEAPDVVRVTAALHDGVT